MPKHPHQAILDEYAFALGHLAPTVPKEVKEEALNTHAALLGNPHATEDEIRAALSKTGLAEYPHRHAFKELTSRMEEERRLAMVLEHVDEHVRAKLKKHLDAGVPLEEITRSRLFETDFTPEERYQVEDALLDAKDHLKEELEHAAAGRGEAYQALVRKWDAHAQAILKKIGELESLKDKDPKWRDEIAEKAKRFREGFLVTEPDPKLEEVEKEIEYWRGTFGEEI